MKNKKYKAVIYKDNEKIKTVNFGDKRYEQYRDRLGLYSNKDNEDPKRRKLYD